VLKHRLHLGHRLARRLPDLGEGGPRPGRVGVEPRLGGSRADADREQLLL